MYFRVRTSLWSRSLHKATFLTVTAIKPAFTMAEEVLLPPPRKPEATPLSNADFRKFLDTPRRDAAAPNLAKQQRQKVAAEGAGQAAKSKRPHKARAKAEAATEAKEEELYRCEIKSLERVALSLKLRCEQLCCVQDNELLQGFCRAPSAVCST